MQFFGSTPKEWLYDTKLTGVIALVFTSTWRWLGTNILYFLSALQTISPELYDAAYVDGANAWQKFRYVTLPGVKPILIFVITILTYGGLRMFGESYVLWPNSKTPGDIGLTIVLYIYRTAFGQFDMGYASAMSVVLFAFLMILNGIFIKSFGIGRRGGQQMKKRRERIYKITVVIFLLLVAIISLTPFIYLLVTSLVGDMSLVFKNGIALKIKAEMLTFNNYRMLFYRQRGGYFFTGLRTA